MLRYSFISILSTPTRPSSRVGLSAQSSRFAPIDRVDPRFSIAFPYYRLRLLDRSSRFESIRNLGNGPDHRPPVIESIPAPTARIRPAAGQLLGTLADRPDGAVSAKPHGGFIQMTQSILTQRENFGCRIRKCYRIWTKQPQ
eukprot:COSAG02_NODE_9635_length_2153_cov_804.529211_3_plen_142_part_00